MTEVKTPIVLIIEDESLLLEAIASKMKLSGFDVVSCTSGKQALDYLSNIPQLPDAIWLDYYLQDINGLEFMQEIKKNEKWSHIPVLVVSNSASDDKVHNMLALGVKQYVLKAQYRLEELIEIIKNLIKDKAE